MRFLDFAAILVELPLTTAGWLGCLTTAVRRRLTLAEGIAGTREENRCFFCRYRFFVLPVHLDGRAVAALVPGRALPTSPSARCFAAFADRPFHPLSAQGPLWPALCSARPKDSSGWSENAFPLATLLDVFPLPRKPATCRTTSSASSGMRNGRRGGPQQDPPLRERRGRASAGAARPLHRRKGGGLPSDHARAANSRTSCCCR